MFHLAPLKVFDGQEQAFKNINVESILANEIPKFKDFLKHSNYKITHDLNLPEIIVENDHFKHVNYNKKDYDIELLTWESKIMTISYFGDIAL